ncbi:MAG: hypothetical protein AAF363_18000 [Bacteroidota bacterium]
MAEAKKGPQNKKRSTRGKARDDSWIDTDRVVNKAQKIVNSAVNVLEEEIAAGILAAKKIEKKLIDVDEIRSDPDALMNRIRRDSHELLDLFIDGFASITSQLNSVMEELKKNGEEHGKKSKPGPESRPAAAGVSFLEPDGPVKAGEQVSLSMSMFNDELKETQKIELRKSDLIGSGELKIHQRAIAISPRSMSLKPNQERSVEVTIKLPGNSLPGLYNAFITDRYDPRIRILLSLKVTK